MGVASMAKVICGQRLEIAMPNLSKLEIASGLLVIIALNALSPQIILARKKH